MHWQETTQRIREANPIEEVAEECGVRLKRVGKELCGFCPFPDHSERKPSFYVNTEKQVFFCHGCHRGGTVFDLVAIVEKVDFVEARQQLAKRAEIELRDDNQRDSVQSERRQIWEAAVRHWQTSLTTKLLKVIERKWGIRPETAYELRFGYATPGLFKALREQGFRRKAILKANLFRKRKKKLRPFFRNRLIFPILRHGRVVNLVGRVFPDSKANKGQAKFLKLANRKEGKPLPGLYLTDSSRTGMPLIIVEGYSDAAALHQLGHAVVALGGTTSTLRSLKELARFAKTASSTILLFDFDDPGQKAAYALAERLLGRGVHARVALRPHKDLSGSDPAEITRNAGPKAKGRLEELLQAAKPFVDIEIESIPTQTTPAELSSALQAPLHHIAHLDRLSSEAYLSSLAKRFKTSIKALRKELDKIRKGMSEDSSEKSGFAATDYYVLSPSAGLVGDDWFFILPVGQRSNSHFIQAPHLVTSRRSWQKLDSATNFRGKKIVLRSEPFFTQDNSRWPPVMLRRFLKTRKRIKPQFVFESVRSLLTRYMEFQEPEIASFVSIWVIGTHLYPLFNSFPYLQVHGPKESGKTKLLTVLGFLAFNAIVCSSLRPAGLFRIVERSGATLLLDEAERLNSKDNPELAELLRAGYKRPSYAIRVQEENMEPRRFDVYGPKAIANISGLEDVLGSRCVPVPMLRALDPQKANRGVTVRSEKWGVIRGHLYRFAMNHFASVKALYDKSQVKNDQSGLQGRNYELWAPILTIARFLEKKGCEGLVGEMTKLATRRAKEQKTTSLSDWDTAVLLAIYDLKLEETEVIQTPDVIERMPEYLAEDDHAPSSKYIGAAIRRLGLGTGRKVMGRFQYQISRSRVVDRMRRYGVEYKTLADEKKLVAKAHNAIEKRRRP